MPPDRLPRIHFRRTGEHRDLHPGRTTVSRRITPQLGILHRDVKPANVLLERSGRAVLTDFGIALFGGSSGLTRTGDIVGSPDYLAPERAAGHRPGPPSDLWSLGATLYAAVEGQSPFWRTSTLSTLQAVISDPLPEPRHAGPLARSSRRCCARTRMRGPRQARRSACWRTWRPEWQPQKRHIPPPKWFVPMGRNPQVKRPPTSPQGRHNQYPCRRTAAGFQKTRDRVPLRRAPLRRPGARPSGSPRHQSRSPQEAAGRTRCCNGDNPDRRPGVGTYHRERNNAGVEVHVANRHPDSPAAAYGTAPERHIDV
ncbi:serine/threonine-protein kinase [Streptomyces sp. YGL11-2]|uniref:serine/threonine-protein kinase n=1 Tax=Streptomyces sp. YGL11-2 TaxID=3414028 RepID=UPI003CEE00D3